MEVGLLGPLEVAGPDGRVRIGGAKERLVLALLVLQAGEVVSRDALVDALWGDDPPATAVKTLQGHVARVRRALEAAGMAEVLATREPGYVLCVPADSIDVTGFERHATAGRGALVDGDASRATAELGEALGLWRGEALADCRAGGWAATEAVRLDEQRLSTVEDRIDADLMLGNHGVLVGELESLVARHPLRERMWAALMLALYRAGRQADALRAYQRARDVLVGELGLEPGAELRRLEAAVLAGDPALDTPDLTHRTPRHIAFPPVLDAIATRGPVFVGRDAEVELLAKAWKQALAGERQVVLVAGEPGLGKSRLAAELAREAFDAGGLVLYGRCDEELTSPYRPWVEALGHYFTNAGDDDFAGLDARVLGELAVLVPAVRDRQADGVAAGRPGGDGDQYVLFAAVTELLATLAERRPVVVVLDDLHWADLGTLLLLRHVVGQISAASLLIVGTYRDTDIGVDDPLTATLAALHREPSVERVGLVGLSAIDIVALLEATAGHDLGADGTRLAHALYNETGGNPFFVGELLRHLAETGVIAQQYDGRWIATVDLDAAGLPQSVREVVGARVRRLGDDSHRVLGAAAVVGRDFDAAIVAGAVDLDADTVVDILEPAMAAGLVGEVAGVSDRFTFTHALVQHTLYQDLPTSRRVRLHRKIAETIETLAGDDTSGRVGELATHWFAATRPADLDKAIGYAIQAGDQAVAALAPDAALRWYRRALDATGDRDEHQRCDLMVRLGDTERQAGDPAYRGRLLDAARLAQQLEDRDLLVAAALANNRGYATVGQVDTERVAVLEAALDAVGHDDSAQRALVLATLASELTFSGDRRHIDLALESVEIARRTGHQDVILDTILKTSSAVLAPDSYAEFDRLTEEAMRLTDGLDNHRRFWALQRRSISLLIQGDMAAIRTCAAEQRAIADRLGQPTLRWTALYADALIELIAGNVDEAERLTHEALALGLESGQPDALIMWGVALTQIFRVPGRDAEMTDALAQGVDDYPGIPSTRASLALNHAVTGDLHAARAVFDPLAEDGFTFPEDYVWLVANTAAAETACLLEDRAAALLLSERLEPHRELIAANGAACTGAVSHYLGCLAVTLGRDEQAERYLTDALARHERLEAPFFRARTMLELAHVIRTREPERAHTLLDQALTLADTYGMASIREQALALRRLDTPPD